MGAACSLWWLHPKLFCGSLKKKVWHVNNNNNIALENIYRNEGMFRHAQAPFVGVAFSATVHVISFSSISPTKWDWLTGHKKKTNRWDRLTLPVANRPFLCFPALPLFVFLLRITYRSSTWRLYKSIKLIYESAFFFKGKGDIWCSRLALAYSRYCCGDVPIFAYDSIHWVEYEGESQKRIVNSSDVWNGIRNLFGRRRTEDIDSVILCLRLRLSPVRDGGLAKRSPFLNINANPLRPSCLSSAYSGICSGSVDKER